ncbi:hypothetical protein GCM10023238_17870 [Streptomyces heliomycini]
MAVDRRGGELVEGHVLPQPGNYAQDPSDTSGYASDNQGVVWVTFDESTGGAGTATKTVYVGVADKENAVYRSTDAGATWQRIAGQPTGHLAHKGVLDAENGYLYLAYSDTGGPTTAARAGCTGTRRRPAPGRTSARWRRPTPTTASAV